MTDREIFNFVKNHLLTQNARAVNEDAPGTGCAYRTPDGKKCAVGCLITDGEYTSLIEGAIVGSLRLEYGQWVGGGFASSGALAEALNRSNIPATPDTHHLLDCLQRIHDSHEPHQWPDLLDRLEEIFFGTAP